MERVVGFAIDVFVCGIAFVAESEEALCDVGRVVLVKFVGAVVIVQVAFYMSCASCVVGVWEDQYLKIIDEPTA